jgi:hypothetical protein
MPVPLDKLTRIVAWVFGGDVEFLAMTVNVANEFDVDPQFNYVATAQGCVDADRDVNLTDRYRYLRKIGFQTERGQNASMYARNADDVFEWGGNVMIRESDLAGIVISPDYPTMTDVPFSDWQYLGVSESADVLLNIRENAGEQDWYKIFVPHDGSIVHDSDGNIVMAPDLNVPFKTGTSTQHLIKAREFTSGPICTDNNLNPEIEEASLTGTIAGEVTAHEITISFGGFHPIIRGETSASEELPTTDWEAFAFAVSPEQNASTVQILLRPVES